MVRIVGLVSEGGALGFKTLGERRAPGAARSQALWRVGGADNRSEHRFCFQAGSGRTSKFVVWCGRSQCSRRRRTEDAVLIAHSAGTRGAAVSEDRGDFVI